MNISFSPSVWKFDTGIPGPKLAIVWGIHGDEYPGIEAIKWLSSVLIPQTDTSITLQKWSVTLILGNMEAMALRKRQKDMNLNRAFLEDNLLTDEQKTTYEYKRSREIARILQDCEAMLDLHSSPADISPVFAIAEWNADAIIPYLPIPIRVGGFDSVEPGGTDYYMNRSGKIGICVECGGQNDPNSFLRAKECSLSFLSYFSVISQPPTRMENQKNYQAKFAYITQTNNFQIAENFPDFQEVQEWQLLGKDGNEKVYAPWDGNILFATNRNLVWVEGFVLIQEVK